jgi:DNA repair exonuclease SbcCD ATPase subunit
MKILFKELRYKNILSTGNSFTKIQLNGRTTTLISGSNGAGKSTMLDAIVFALYGKPFRKINKPQLINSINQKDMVVEVDFQIGKIDFTVKRGIRPNVFEIYRNGSLVDQDAASRDYQSYLEKSILNLNYKSFNQIVILGSATYVPFMELPAHSRREIIEDLLDIQVFSTMNQLLKEKLSNNKEQITENSYQKDLIESKLESAKEHNASIKQIRQDEVDKIKEKMNEHISKIEKGKESIEKIQDEIVRLVETIGDKAAAVSKNDKAKSLKRDLETNLRATAKELTFYHDHDNCPTCKQGIDHEFKDNIVNEKQTFLDQIEDGLKQIDIKIEDIEKRLSEISKIEDEISAFNLEIGDHRASIKVAKNALVSYKKELDSAEEQVEAIDTSKLIELSESLTKIDNEQTELYNHKEVLAVVSQMLKDGGIKSKIIRQYIPIMNKLINKYLAAFDLFVDFQIDENFNEVIKSRFRDTFSYSSFSEGEKLRITLSIMLAWRTVAKLRNSVSTNLLVLDETLDGAMDGVGVENLIETLHNLNADDNIFVISHRGDQFGDKFESHIKFQKVKNFSEIAA